MIIMQCGFKYMGIDVYRNCFRSVAFMALKTLMDHGAVWTLSIVAKSPRDYVPFEMTSAKEEI